MEGEYERERRQSWRPAVSEDRPLNHRTEFHLAFRLLSTESTTYLPVDLDLLRSDAPPRPPFAPPAGPPRGPPCFTGYPPRAFPIGAPFLIFSSSLASVHARRMRSGRLACCTFHGCLQLRIMNIDNTAGREERPTIVPMSISQRPLRALAIRADRFSVSS